MDLQHFVIGEAGGMTFHSGLRVDRPQVLNIGLSETGSATIELPAVGELEHAPDMILPLHIQIGELIDTAAPIAAVSHTEMPTANDARELDVLQQHVVAVSSIVGAHPLALLVIHLAIEETGAQSLDKINHDRIKLVLRAF
jgi:hypothetical protein